MEIYEDDILIKSQEAQYYEATLRESFENLRKYNLRKFSWVHDQPERDQAQSRQERRGFGYAKSKNSKICTMINRTDRRLDAIHLKSRRSESSLHGSHKEGQGV
ncbi:hypothetical protein LIER_31715 [Lithospermum erythrorhizon]|uniref:Reverse transcriptase domain-containing protein n=1 Tax=Lithospermum erythrorhizon TaxID=34254 RepID=A0AAV3RVS8_LITER